MLGPVVLLRTRVPSLSVVGPAYRCFAAPPYSVVPGPVKLRPAPVWPVNDAATSRSVAAAPSLIVSVRPVPAKSTPPDRVTPVSAALWSYTVMLDGASVMALVSRSAAAPAAEARVRLPTVSPATPWNGVEVTIVGDVPARALEVTPIWATSRWPSAPWNVTR